MEKIGIYGGSYNPVHIGHVKMARIFKDDLSLDKVMIIPANIPPHKQNKEILSGAHRMKMCKLAFCEPCFEVSDIELAKDSVSYTYETLRQILSRREAELYLFCGADMFLTIQDWKNPEDIFSMATIVTVPRNDSDVETLQAHAERLEKMGARAIVINTSTIDVSSSEIREKLKNNEDVSSLLPEKVIDYIKENKLYRR